MMKFYALVSLTVANQLRGRFLAPPRPGNQGPPPPPPGRGPRSAPFPEEKPTTTDGNRQYHSAFVPIYRPLIRGGFREVYNITTLTDEQVLEDIYQSEQAIDFFEKEDTSEYEDDRKTHAEEAKKNAEATLKDILGKLKKELETRDLFNDIEFDLKSVLNKKKAEELSSHIFYLSRSVDELKEYAKKNSTDLTAEELRKFPQEAFFPDGPRRRLRQPVAPGHPGELGFGGPPFSAAGWKRAQKKLQKHINRLEEELTALEKEREDLIGKTGVPTKKELEKGAEKQYLRSTLLGDLSYEKKSLTQNKQLYENQLTQYGPKAVKKVRDSLNGEVKTLTTTLAEAVDALDSAGTKEWELQKKIFAAANKLNDLYGSGVSNDRSKIDALESKITEAESEKAEAEKKIWEFREKDAEENFEVYDATEIYYQLRRAKESVKFWNDSDQVDESKESLTSELDKTKKKLREAKTLYETNEKKFNQLANEKEVEELKKDVRKQSIRSDLQRNAALLATVVGPNSKKEDDDEKDVLLNDFANTQTQALEDAKKKETELIGLNDLTSHKRDYVRRKRQETNFAIAKNETEAKEFFTAQYAPTQLLLDLNTFVLAKLKTAIVEKSSEQEFQAFKANAEELLVKGKIEARATTLGGLLNQKILLGLNDAAYKEESPVVSVDEDGKPAVDTETKTKEELIDVVEKRIEHHEAVLRNYFEELKVKKKWTTEELKEYEDQTDASWKKRQEWELEQLKNVRSGNARYRGPA